MTEPESADAPKTAERGEGGSRFKRAVASFEERSSGAREQAVKRYESLEKSRRIGVLLLTGRRFVEIEGSNLSSLMTLGLFVGFVPLILLVMNISTNVQDMSGVVSRRYHLTGATLEMFQQTFSLSAAQRGAASLMTACGFILVAYSVAKTMQTAFCRAWEVEVAPGYRGVLRGAAWFLLSAVPMMLTEGGLALSERGPWMLAVLVPFWLALTFCFWWLTPRLLVNRPLGWRGLVATAAAGTVVTLVLRVASRFVIPSWIDYYSSPLGALGAVIAIVFWIWVIAYAWVGIACFGAVMWERTADADRVVAVQLGVADGEAS